MTATTLTPALTKAQVLKELGLPKQAKASDVIQYVINSTGHRCSLMELMILANLFDGNIQLYITDNEKASVGEPRTL